MEKRVGGTRVGAGGNLQTPNLREADTCRPRGIFHNIAGSWDCVDVNCSGFP